MIRLVRFADRDIVEEHRLVTRGVGVGRVIVSPEKKSSTSVPPGPWLFPWTHLDELVEVYIPAPNLA